MNRTLLSSSFNDSPPKHHLNRTLSFREPSSRGFNLEGGKRSNGSEFDSKDLSPPSSPKVKAVVEKSDSVSYVLEMEESPEIIANKILRRSFRNLTPPKTSTPTKCSAIKRPRMKANPLSLSASAGAIISNGNKNESIR